MRGPDDPIMLTDAELDQAIARNMATLDEHDPGWRSWPIPDCRHINCLAADHPQVAGAVRGLNTGLSLQGIRLMDWLAQQRLQPETHQSKEQN